MILYCTYLSWSALAGRPSDVCNPYMNYSGTTVAQIFCGLLFTLISLFGTSMMSASNDEEEKSGTNGMNAALIEKVDDSEIRDMENAAPEEPHVFPISTATIFFQVLMMFACLYYCMLITNWGSANISDEKTVVFENNWFSFYVKMGAQWVSFLLYQFSLLGPVLLPD